MAPIMTPKGLTTRKLATPEALEKIPHASDRDTKIKKLILPETFENNGTLNI